MTVHILLQGYTLCGKDPRFLGFDRWVRREEREQCTCEECKESDASLTEFEAIQVDPTLSYDERTKKSLRFLAERFGGKNL